MGYKAFVSHFVLFQDGDDDPSGLLNDTSFLNAFRNQSVFSFVEKSSAVISLNEKRSLLVTIAIRLLNNNTKVLIPY